MASKKKRTLLSPFFGLKKTNSGLKGATIFQRLDFTASNTAFLKDLGGVLTWQGMSHQLPQYFCYSHDSEPLKCTKVAQLFINTLWSLRSN